MNANPSFDGYPCPDCPPKEKVCEICGGKWAYERVCNALSARRIIESQERNAAASEILIGDLTKKIEGMKAKL